VTPSDPAISPDQAQSCDLAVIGMGVMGRSIALNMADHGRTVAIYDLDRDAVDRVPHENPPESFAQTGGGIVPCRSVNDVARALKKPRAALVLVPAGRPTDGPLDDLLYLLTTEAPEEVLRKIRRALNS